MKESVFQKEVVNSFKEHGGWACKIPDMPIGKQHKGESGHFRFNVEKPFDIIAMYNRRAIAIECKQMKKLRSFKLGDVRDSQIKALTEVEQSAGVSYIFLNIRIAKPYENRLIIMPWGLVYWALENGNKISKDVLEKCPCIYGKNGLFDIREWLTLKFGG